MGKLSYKHKYALMGAAIVPCFGRVALHGTGVEHEFYRYLVPMFVGGLAGWLIGLMKERWDEVQKGLSATNEDLKKENIDRKQTEILLRESEKKLYSLLQSIQAAVIVHGPNTEIVRCNNAAQELLGMTESQLLGKESLDSSWKFFNADGSDMSLMNYPVNQVMTTRKGVGDLVVGIYRSNRKDVVWVLVNAVPEFDSAGSISQVIMTFMDITDRRLIERERERLIDDLKGALEKINTLSGLLPICSFCNMIRDDKGYWNHLEAYVIKHSDAEFSHSICPECAKKHYPDIDIYDLT